MRTVLQRTDSCSVSVENREIASIKSGMLVLLGIEEGDHREDAAWLAKKICQMRLFPDEDGVMNLDIKASGGDLLVVSQFTLHASTKKGNRPSYIKAARPEQAIPLYEYFIEELENIQGKKVGRGQFGAMMKVSLVNDGPVTIIMDSKNKE